MANAQGTPIWYELLTEDAAASKAFYDSVIGWTIADRSQQPGLDYRMIATADQSFVGGMMPITPEMASGGMKPGWHVYISADDVDATVATIEAAGGSVRMPAMTLEGVGRMAMVADPQGIAFYVMRGASPDSSTAWDPTALGKCAWNELNTPDQPAANAFYAEVFGWTYPSGMPMGGSGEYAFIDAAGLAIGATMPRSDPALQHWLFYFRTPDADAAAEKVRAGGGTVLAGPAEVPGGNRMIVASDPHGVTFGAVGPGH